MRKNFYGDNKMFHILICDDENPTCSYIEKVLLDYGEKETITILTEVFYTGNGLLEYMKQHNDVDLIFLDIELPEVNGAEVGNMLRDNLKNESVQIIYISSYEKYAMQLFRVRPFDFLIKPLSQEVILEVFEKYRRLFENDQKYFEYKVGKHTERILLSDVIYFKSEYRKICYVTSDEKVYFYGNIKELHKTLNVGNFWSVHNSFIINIRYVKQFKESEIIMSNDNVIPISNTYKNEVKRKIMQMNEDRE